MYQNDNVPEPFRCGIFAGHQTDFIHGEIPTYIRDKQAKHFTYQRQHKYNMSIDEISSKVRITKDILNKVESGEYIAPVRWWRELYKLLDNL